MKKIIYTLVVLAAVICAKAQTNHYFWLDGKLMLGTQIAATDSLTYGEEDTDSIWLYLPRTVIRTVHDTVIQTVIVHDTITQTVAVHDTVTQIAHDTVYMACDEGALTGRFSVSATTTVLFSKGNLQYQASTNTWRFAEHQYDTIGAANSNISNSYSGWIDLFGWGTGNNPTNTSTNSSDYATFTDWGTNAIFNGGNTANLWRTLTKNEWVYLFDTRTNAGNLYGMGNIDGINGLIVLPDNWTLPSGLSFVDETSNKNFSANTYTVAQWQVMESAGAVFLPTAGYRSGTTMDGVSRRGHYWSSSAYDSDNAYFVYLRSIELNEQTYDNRSHGYSVRLVR